MKLSGAKLTLRERISLGQNLRAAVRSADLRFSDALPALEPLAQDAEGAVATEPALLLATTARYLSDDALAALRRHAAGLYRDACRRLGWDAAPGEAHSRQLFRGEVVRLMLDSRDPEATAEGARRGKAYLGKSAFDPRAVDPELAGPALGQYVRQGGAAAFDEVLARLEKTEDSELRARILRALGAALDARLSRRALDLGLDPRLRKNERLTILAGQLRQRETREQAWSWLQAHFDELAREIPEQHAASVPSLPSFCDPDHLAQMQAFFAPRVEKIPSAPRSLKQALERTRLCIAEAAAQGADAESFFRKTSTNQDGYRGSYPAPKRL
jgi:aminopeptidase N